MALHDDLDMNTQQEIAECEEELSSLLCGVLAGTLKPIKASLDACEQRLADLEKEVGTLRSASQEVSQKQQSSQNELKRLSSRTEDGLNETASRMEELLGESRTSLLAAQEQSHASIGECLQRHAFERAEWITHTLGSKMEEGIARQQSSVVETRDVLVRNILELRAGGEAMGRRLAELLQHVGGLSQTVQRLEAAGAAAQSDASEERRQVAARYDESMCQSQAAIDTALRPVRRMLAVALVLATGGLLLGVAGHWSMFLK